MTQTARLYNSSGTSLGSCKFTFKHTVSSGGFRSTVTKGTPSSSALTATCTNRNLVSNLGSNCAPKIRLTNGKHSIGFKLNNIIENKTSGSAQAGPTYFIKQYFTQL